MVVQRAMVVGDGQSHKGKRASVSERETEREREWRVSRLGCRLLTDRMVAALRWLWQPLVQACEKVLANGWIPWGFKISLVSLFPLFVNWKRNSSGAKKIEPKIWA